MLNDMQPTYPGTTWTDYRLTFSDGSNERFLACSDDSAKAFGEKLAEERLGSLVKVEKTEGKK